MTRIKRSLLRIITFLLLTGSIISIQAQRISVEGTTLTVNGNPIHINGANLPWISWNDFGDDYNHYDWAAEFAKFRAAKGNSLRIWITCSTTGAIRADENGVILPPPLKFWNDLDDMFALAEHYQIYIKATLISFDHTADHYVGYENFRKMYGNGSNVDSFIDNYVIPFVDRYKDNPYLFSIEPCNEIEWVNQQASNAQVPWTDLQYFVAKVVAAVHENSDILTTIGCNVKWQTDVWPGNESNQFSDERLRAAYNDPEVYLDFYSPHFWEWTVEWYGNPFDAATVEDYGLDDKPVIIGEVPAIGIAGVSINDAYFNAFQNGFQGVMAWSVNGVDNNGSLDTGLGDALTAFANEHPDLVFPDSVATGTRPEDELEVLHEYKLFQNYPNPFNPTTLIKYSLQGELKVSLIIYDMLGREVSTLVDEVNSAGSYEVEWDASNYPSGLYLYTYTVGEYSDTKKMLLVK